VTGACDAPLHPNLLHYAAHLPHSRDEFQGKLTPLDGRRCPLFLRANRFLQYYLWPGRSHRRLDEVGSGVAHRHASNHRATLPSVLFCERRKHSGIGAHWKAGLSPGSANRQPVCRLHQTICARQHRQRRSRWCGGLRFAVTTWDYAKPNGDLALPGRARTWSRRALLHHAWPGGGEFLDRTGARPGLRLLQFPEYCPLSGRDLPADFSHDIRLGHSGGDHREYCRPPAHQIAWTTDPADAASRYRIQSRLLAVTRFLAVRSTSLFERQLVT